MRTICIWFAVFCVAILTFPLSARAQFNTIINVPPDVAPASIGSYTQLNLFDEGSIGNGFFAGAADGTSTNVEVNISGGTVGNRFLARGSSTVNISGGSVALDLDFSVLADFEATDDSTVNISGGTMGNGFEARGGPTVNISGGTVGHGFIAYSSSIVKISGGTVGDGFSADGATTVTISGGTVGRFFRAGSDVTISGGVVGNGFQADDGSNVFISGEEFQIDGQLVAGLDQVGDQVQVNIPNGSVVAGALSSDDRMFAFGSFRGDSFADGTLTLVRGPDLPLPAPVVNVPTDPAPQGLRGGQTLNLYDGGVLGEDFIALNNNEVTISGGDVGSQF